MSKNIVFCADGLWNSPRRNKQPDQTTHPTNVAKLFLMLDGEVSPDSRGTADEQEKALSQAGQLRQVAQYLNCAGSAENAAVNPLGGTGEAGILAPIVRGYTFISRNYLPGDRIFLTGFSRGAHAARALAGFIAHQGLLAPALCRDTEDACRKAEAAWLCYRKSCSGGSCLKPAESYPDPPTFVQDSQLGPGDFVPVEQLAAVGVWETVGRLGIPAFAGDESLDALGFNDTKLHDRVAWGFHAVSLDERRSDLPATLWEPRDQIKQVLFPGTHGDVGGGYPAHNNESDLSDLALEWMMEELTTLGLAISCIDLPHYYPAVGGVGHEPWRTTICQRAIRRFPTDLVGHHSLALRGALVEVLADPAAVPAPYRPENLPQDICTVGLDGVTADAEGICAWCVLRD